jgi:Na+-driven multidrug efflux pump
MIKMDNVDSNEQELLSGNIRKTVWKYGIPCALITIINTLYNIVDQSETK